jgi:hypothetical protein
MKTKLLYTGNPGLMAEIPTPNLTPESVSPQIDVLIREIRQIPAAQWGYLLQILRIFRLSVAASAQATEVPVNQAAIELLRSWREEGDEVEQRETWQFLQQALDHDRLSNRPLFPPS